MGANSSYKAMYDIVEQAKDGTIIIPDDFTTCGTPDAVRSGLSRLCRDGKLHRFAKGKSITFRHINDLGNFAYQSKLMQLAVIAMREIDEKMITEEQVAKIKNMITGHVAEQDLNHDIVLAPTWIKTILQR